MYIILPPKVSWNPRQLMVIKMNNKYNAAITPHEE